MSALKQGTLLLPLLEEQPVAVRSVPPPYLVIEMSLL
jgi:hypothetical protein